MKTKKIIINLAIALIALILILECTYIVKEPEQVVITQFGKPVGQAKITPGLKVKLPFIQKPNYFDKRFLEWDGDPNQVPTKDKKFIFVDAYARWQITDPLQFFKRLTNERGAQSRLDDILDGETRDYIANHDLEEAVRTSNRTPIPSDLSGEEVGDTLSVILTGRQKIQEMILRSANEKAKDLGIEILNYVEEVRVQVYERMKSERFRIAEKFRSEGQGEASKINGEKERDLKTIQSEAFRKAEEIMGKADARATAIYAAAYDKSSSARNLYSFSKSMETFERTFDTTTTVILSTKSELYKYLIGFD